MVERWAAASRVQLLSLVAAVIVFFAGTVTALLADPNTGDQAASAERVGSEKSERVPAAPPTTSTSTTVAPTTTLPPTTSAPPTTAPPTTAPPPTAAADTVGARFTMDPYAGLGAWIDVFDWSWTFTQGQPHIGAADIDRMASLGVRTLFVQASRYDHPADIVDQDLLDPIIERAHADGMRVVGWYLPTLTDPNADLRRTLAMAALPIDGVAVDIESRDVDDIGERNARLVAYVGAVRAALPGEVLSAIVMPPVLMEDVNPNFWPGFPWADLGPVFDVWQTMGYWTNRRADSGWRDGYAYTAVNIDRVRAHIGRPDAPVHPIGGVGDESTPEQVAGMVQASMERGVLGGSLYDYRTTGDAVWEILRAFNG